MQGDDPPYLPVGTAVSAKYKGAFCEAKVSKVVRCVKCKITFKMGLGQATVTDEMIRGPLRVGHTVQARHSEKKEFIEATISKIQDCSQYTVVFDDGDITTLRRTALCLKSGRHFNESETLDQLPLTHPEHFGNPVVGGRRGRRSRQLKEDSSEGEPEEENEPDLVLYSSDIGKVVCVEGNEKKKSRDNWFPGLVVVPSAQPTVRINVREEYLVRSFKDGRYYTVPKKEISEFTRDLGNRIESTILSEAMDKAIKYLDRDELPVHWERATLFDLHIPDSDSDENYSDSSDDEPREEKDHFVAQLYKFMDDRGTPLNKSPMISNRDVDLYRLFRVVHKMGGFNRVTNQSKWRSVSIRLGYQHNHATYNSVKQFYKKYLFSFEEFYRKLGCTMINHPRNAKKHRGRNLIRDRDRATPVNSSPRPERSDESVSESSDKKEDKEKEKSTVVETPTKAKAAINKKEQKKEKEGIELSDSSNEGTSTSSSSTFTECTQTVVFQSISAATEGTSTAASKKKTTVAVAEVAVPPMAAVTSSAATTLALTPAKAVKERKVKAAAGDKVKALVEHFEEQNKKEGPKENSKEEEEEQSPPQQQQQQQTVQVQQQTRSKSQSGPKVKEKEVSAVSIVVEKKEVIAAAAAAAGLRSKVPKKPEEDKQRRGRKRKDTETEASKETGLFAATSTSTTSAEPVVPPATSTTATTITSSTTPQQQQIVNIGDKLKVYYGPTHESKVTYEAKVLDINRNASGIIYRVHYTGWNTRYDEWIKPARIAENLSTATKAKRLKQQAQTGKLTPTKAAAAKRGRGTSISSRAQEPPPRSTTPSSVTSSSSRTKSPATPASNKAPRVTRGSDTTTRRTRRTSAILSDSDSDSEEQSESEISRTRSGGKSAKLTAKRKDEDNNKDSEKEDEEKPTRRPPTFKRKKEEPPSPLVETDDELGDDDEEEEEGDDDENNSSPPKGRDFDLNQIRSELKGFEKAVKISTSSEAASESTPDEHTTATSPPLSLSAAKDIELKINETETTKSEKSEKSAADKTEKFAADKTEKSTEKLSKTQNEKTDDIYEFKEPEPFEFEARPTTKLGEEKGAKKRLVSRLFDDLETSKSPPKKKGGKSPSPKATDEEKKPRTFGKRTPGKAAAAKLLQQQQQQQQQEEEEDGDEKNEKANVKEETTPVKAAEKHCDDPFDKLVESPSFNLIAGADKKASPPSGDAKPKVVKALNMDESARDFAPPLQTPATVVKKDEEEDEEEEKKNKKKKDGSRKSIKFCNDNEEALFIGKEPLLFTDVKPDPIPSSSIKISEHPIFGGFNAGKSSPDTATEADDVKKKKKRKKKDGASDEDDLIKAAIQRAISNTMTDEDSAEDDLFMAQSAQSAQMFPSTKINTIQGFKVKEELLLAEDLKEPLSINTTDTSSPLLTKESSKDSKESKEVKAKQISPALQETNSSLLEAISLQTEMLKKEEPREPQIKTGGTKIADSILQKFNMIKKNEKEDEVVMKLPPLASECTVAIKIEKEEEKEKEKKIKAESAEALNTVSIKVEEQAAPHIVLTAPTPDFHLETNKKRSNKKVMSREFIEESESDSTDSEERLIIARSDDDSQTNPSSDKLDFKDTDNSNSIQTGANTTDDSQEEAPMTTELATPAKGPGDAEPSEMASVATGKSEENAPLPAVKSSESEESESNISLLLCKETIPGSPAPVTEMSPAPVEPRAKPKSAKSLLLEMPFASAPGTSNSKGMLSSGSGVQEMDPTAKQPTTISVAANVNTTSSSSNKQDPQPPLAVPLEQQQIEAAPMVATINNAIDSETNINNNNNSGGPTTPESTISNLSPNTDRVSPPNTVDNETCKSTDSGRNLKRYCQEMEEEEEDDALLDTEPPPVPPTVAAVKELVTGAAPCRKRRRSCKGDEIPVKRGRKPNVRSLRANSDSDDTSEHSAPGSTPPASSSLSSSTLHLSSISSRPCKFNFIIELDSSMDSAQRISLLTQKLSELRKTYNTVKTELACIDRRRKKLRRREREALKASKQELACS